MVKKKQVVIADTIMKYLLGIMMVFSVAISLSFFAMLVLIVRMYSGGLDYYNEMGLLKFFSDVIQLIAVLYSPVLVYMLIKQENKNGD